MLNKYLLLLLAATGLCLIVLSSWKPRVESYIVTGKIEAINGSAAHAKIRYTQNEREYNPEKMHAIDVDADGAFSTVINVEVHGQVYFFVDKEGYALTRHPKILTDLKGANDIGVIATSSLYPPPSYRQLLDEELLPRLYLYEDVCLQRFDNDVSIGKIAFFENLRLLNSCSGDPDAAILSARINLNGRYSSGKTAYFKLRKQENGEAFIVEETAAPATSVPTPGKSLLAAEKED